MAIIGMAAHFGPWDSLRAVQERVLGGGERHEPRPPSRWWGAEQSAWFKAAGLSADDFHGHYLDRLTVPPDRFRIPPRELEEMLPQQLLMLQVAAAAIEDCRFAREYLLRTGVFVGIALDLNTTNFHVRWWLLNQARLWNEQLGLNLSAADLEEWTRQLRDAAGPPLTANRTMGALGSIIASRLSREFRLGGPSFTVSSEETSGLHALQTAVRLLQQGELDQAIVGAVDLAGDVRAVLAGNPRRPVGEGAAAVILKRHDDALRDGDRVYAVIRGIGSAVGGGVDEPAAPRASATALHRATEEARTAVGVDSPAERAESETRASRERERSEEGNSGRRLGGAVVASACVHQRLRASSRRLRFWLATTFRARWAIGFTLDDVGPHEEIATAAPAGWSSGAAGWISNPCSPSMTASW